jgi:hypothetical protein
LAEVRGEKVAVDLCFDEDNRLLGADLAQDVDQLLALLKPRQLVEHHHDFPFGYLGLGEQMCL